MANPTIFDIFMGVGQVIQNVDPTMKLIVKGADMPSLEEVDEWLQLDILGEFSAASRRTVINAVIPFQLTCFTKAAPLRKEAGPTKFARHVELAAIYKPFLHQQDILVKNTCIRLEECRISFLDLRTSTFTAQSIATGTTPSLQTQSAVILVDARIITNKE